MDGKFHIVFPLEEKYFVSLRLATAGVCDIAGLDVEETEDFKLCVAEACLALMRAGFCCADVSLAAGGGIAAEVTGRGEGCACRAAGEGERFTLSLLRELVPEVDIEEREGRVSAVSLRLPK